jgi:pimeloyl-ACP methyl ester carboxylesterase
MAATRKAGDVVIERASFAVSTTQSIDYELGTLYVPENRADPKSRIIGVGFARFKALEPNGAPPTFHLPGGPGSSLIASLKEPAAHVLRYRIAGDVVLVDQRGFSERGEVLKYKRQPEPIDEPASLERATRKFVDLAREAVGDFAKRGIDLRGYTVKECAADVNDLRRALGYDKIIPVANSFGSQWSFAIMRLFPQIVERAMLSGVEPLDLSYDMPSFVVAAMRRFWKEAEQDKKLQPYIPAGGLEAAVREILDRLEKSPAKVEVNDPVAGDRATVTLGREDFQRDILKKSADGPAWILAAYHKHYDTWATSVLQRRRRPDDLRIIGPCIDCCLGATAKRLQQLSADPATEFVGQWNWNVYVATAGIWPTQDVGDDFRLPKKTLTPVLFVQGDWDLQTPVENAMEAVQSFPNGRLLLVERGEHSSREPIARTNPKTFEAMMEFLRTGNMQNVPDRVTLPPQSFAIPDFPAP